MNNESTVFFDDNCHIFYNGWTPQAKEKVQPASDITESVITAFDNVKGLSTDRTISRLLLHVTVVTASIKADGKDSWLRVVMFFHSQLWRFHGRSS